MSGFIPDWPSTLGKGDFELDRVGATFDAPMPMSFGAGQSWAADSGTWLLRLRDVPLHDVDGSVLTGRAMMAWLQPPYDAVNIPLKDKARSPRARLGLPRAAPGVTYFDGASFSDGSLFAGAITDCTLTAAAVARDTLVTVTMQNGVALTAGDFIGFGDPGDYKRAHIVGAVATNDDGSLTLSRLWPPLRNAYAAGTRVELEDPMVACKVKWPSLPMAANRWTRVTYEFTEIPNPA